MIVRITGWTFPDESVSRQPSRRLGQRRRRSNQWRGVADGNGARIRRAGRDRLETEADDHPGTVGRRGVGPPRLHRVGRSTTPSCAARASSTSTATAPGRGGSRPAARTRCSSSSPRWPATSTNPRPASRCWKWRSVRPSTGCPRPSRPRPRRTRRPDSAVGSGSDFTPFLQHLTLASLNLGFGGESHGGVYHSVYDSFERYTKYSTAISSSGGRCPR